ncbi:hypothetical protein [Pseudoalteromonas sp. T1lg22]|uniref:hypothetical protein n=1 Tax=Pseudoalteromonas sp. T1lg22 TaxID=2077096 RepID=UPI000CF615FE|nr:hypothetical protein [Pseudoalteromonas sp. T1lg22]
MSDNNFKRDLRTAFGYDHKRAAIELGVSYSTYRKYWNTGVAPKPIKSLVSIIARGYLPANGPWQHFKIEGDLLVTPYGSMSAGDCAYHHRKSWAATHYQAEYKKLRKQKLAVEEIHELQDKLLNILVAFQE